MELPPLVIDRFTARPYQRQFLDELFVHKKKKRFLLVWPRRSGKDLTAFHAAIRTMVAKPTQVYFIYPTYSQGKRILWSGLDNEGFPLLDYLPKELIESKNGHEMSIRLINGSTFTIVGSEDPNRLIGTNASFMVFSEFAVQNPQAWQYLRQVVRANNGTAIFISTPRSKNHMYEMYQYALTDPEWYVSRLTLDDTKHITEADLAKERESCSEELIQQEWFCSFDRGQEGSYYAEYINNLRLNNQIGSVPWQPHLKVNCALDLGFDDKTACVWYQLVGQVVNIIDYHELNKKDLAYWCKFIQDKPYNMNKIIWPHDMRVTEFGSGLTRFEQAARLGLHCTIAPKLTVQDGIEAVRALLPRCWIDEKRCALLIKHLESYHQTWNEVTSRYDPKPVHDSSSDAADAFRYLAVSLPMITDSLSASDLDLLYRQGQFGQNQELPRNFQHPNTMQW